MDKTTTRAFRVVVVGAGVSGLVVANLLARANIDFVLVEAHKDVFYPAGGSFGIWPNAARILDQIGCWEDIENSYPPFKVSYVRRPNGSPSITSHFTAKISSEYGYEFRVLERHEYIQILHRKLQDKSKIQTGKRVTDISEHKDCVRVHFEDGGVCEGDIVVGCDGVHSKVREIMWTNASQVSPGVITAAEKRSLTSSYRCLVGAGPPVPGIAANESNVIQNYGIYILIVTQPQRCLFFVCIKRESTSHWPIRSKFTAADAEAEAAKIADMPVTSHALFGEVWARRTRGYLCSLEEGIYEHWYSNRTVLVGDAAHKLSPVGAHGGNCGVESAAALVNSLHRRLCLWSGPSLDSMAIQSIFEQYQRSRERRVHEAYNSVYFLTRLGSWDTPWKMLLARYVVPWKSDTAAISALMRGAVKVDFIPVPSRSKGFLDVVPGKNSSLLPQGKQVVWSPIAACSTLVAIVCAMLLALQ